MVSFDCDCTRHDGVTLVTATVQQITEPTRVSVENRLDGPIWPPRRQGVPERGWDDTGFETVVSAGTHAIGYATPAEPAPQPAELVGVTAVPDSTPTAGRLSTVEDVVRDLGDPSPPADAVGTAEPTDSEGCSQQREKVSSSLPESVRRWLDDVSRRVDHAEALDEANSIDEVTVAVDDAGGLSSVQTIGSQARMDERMLRTVARRAETLADRRAAATVPVETLTRLA